MTNTFAGEVIEGALGFKLGDVFEASNTPRIKSELCYFPLSGNQRIGKDTIVHPIDIVKHGLTYPFREAFFEITPKSHKIYRITLRAIGFTKDEQKKFTKDLQDKFDTKKDSSKSFGKIIDQGSRHIEMREETQVSVVYVNVPSVATTTFYYTDEDLLLMAVQEAKSIKEDSKKSTGNKQ